MLWTKLLFASLLCQIGSANENQRGFPFYFASFEDVGKSEVISDVLPVHRVDNKITEWTRGCPADAYILIKDHNPFQLSGLKQFQRAAENSLTTGSVLSERLVNLEELGLDLEEYCEADLVKVDPRYLKSIPKQMNTKTRVYTVEFEPDTTPDTKDETLKAIFGSTPTPFVTVIYESTFAQSQPVLRNIQLNPKRLTWQRHKLRHDRDKIAPVIAPLFNSKNIGHSAPEPAVDLPDNFFLTLMIGSFMAVAFLVHRDFTSPKRKPAETNQK